MVAIGRMMRSKITMPAHLMHDGWDPHLFQHFAYVANRIGVYTTNDYVEILESLIGRWRLEKVEGLNGDGKFEQDFVCGLPRRIRRYKALMDERANNTKKKESECRKYSWIFNKEIII